MISIYGVVCKIPCIGTSTPQSLIHRIRCCFLLCECARPKNLPCTSSCHWVDLYICHLNKVIETVMYVRNYSAKFLLDDASDRIVFLVYGWLHQQPLHHLHTLLSLFQDGNELHTCGSPSVSFNCCARGHSDSAL